MEFSQAWNDFGTAVSEAKQKADVVASLKYELAQIVASKQAAIDAAQQEYNDAKVAVDRLKVLMSDVMAELLPVSDPRYRGSN